MNGFISPLISSMCLMLQFLNDFSCSTSAPHHHSVTVSTQHWLVSAMSWHLGIMINFDIFYFQVYYLCSESGEDGCQDQNHLSLPEFKLCCHHSFVSEVESSSPLVSLTCYLMLMRWNNFDKFTARKYFCDLDCDSSNRSWNISWLRTTCCWDPGVGRVLDDLHAGGAGPLPPRQICSSWRRWW